jgi:archaemetzincin
VTDEWRQLHLADKLDWNFNRPVSALLKFALAEIISQTFLSMAFEPPDQLTRLEAIGPTNSLPVALERALTPDNDFAPVPVPGPQDWLAVHHETRQTFEEFRHSRPNRPNGKHRIIYLQPLGEFGEGPSLETLQQYAASFFQLEVKVLPPVNIAGADFTSRTNQGTGRRQILTQDVLRWLKRRLPEDAFCLLGITMQDLYPEASWNFVFGQASLRERVGVYSFARYDPAFYGEPRGADYQKLLLRRSAKVLTHETSHMFGLAHCIYFHCVMNGSNHLQESDRRPMHLCPVCLRKLQWSIGFDVVKHYEALVQSCQDSGFSDEGTWVSRRVEKIRDGAQK